MLYAKQAFRIKTNKSSNQIIIVMTASAIVSVQRRLKLQLNKLTGRRSRQSTWSPKVSNSDLITYNLIVTDIRFR